MIVYIKDMRTAHLFFAQFSQLGKIQIHLSSSATKFVRSSTMAEKKSSTSSQEVKFRPPPYCPTCGRLWNSLHRYLVDQADHREVNRLEAAKDKARATLAKRQAGKGNLNLEKGESSTAEGTSGDGEEVEIVGVLVSEGGGTSSSNDKLVGDVGEGASLIAAAFSNHPLAASGSKVCDFDVSAMADLVAASFLDKLQVVDSNGKGKATRSKAGKKNKGKGKKKGKRN